MAESQGHTGIPVCRSFPLSAHMEQDVWKGTVQYSQPGHGLEVSLDRMGLTHWSFWSHPEPNNQHQQLRVPHQMLP